MKEYPEKIKSIVDEISKLTLLEVADLNELLKVIQINIFLGLKSADWVSLQSMVHVHTRVSFAHVSGARQKFSGYTTNFGAVYIEGGRS